MSNPKHKFDKNLLSADWARDITYSRAVLDSVNEVKELTELSALKWGADFGSENIFFSFWQNMPVTCGKRGSKRMINIFFKNCLSLPDKMKQYTLSLLSETTNTFYDTVVF